MRAPMSRINRQKSCPSLSRADSLRSETVSTPARDARAVSARIAGEGYCDVPSRRREASATPYRANSGVWVISPPLPRRDDLDPVALPYRRRGPRPGRHELAIDRSRDLGLAVVERLQSFRK